MQWPVLWNSLYRIHSANQRYSCFAFENVHTLIGMSHEWHEK